MKILLDMNVSPHWINLLKPHGHEVVHWSSVGRKDEDDINIMTWAASHGHVVMTNDLDFGEILAISGNEKPSVIQLRVGRNDPIVMASLVLAAIEKSSRELEAGALVSIDHVSQRMKLLPLRPEE